jgi:pathogenesis-related protein 1
MSLLLSACGECDCPECPTPDAAAPGLRGATASEFAVNDQVMFFDEGYTNAWYEGKILEISPTRYKVQFDCQTMSDGAVSCYDIAGSKFLLLKTWAEAQAEGIKQGDKSPVPTEKILDVACNNPNIKPSPSTLTQQEKDVVLQKHNELRQPWGNQDLVWDDTLAAYAQGWVNALAEFRAQGAKGGWSDWPHSGGCYTKNYGYYGENLVSGGISVERAMDAFAEEIVYYKKDSRRCEGGVCGHYVQMVHKGVTKVGCAKEPSWACSYDAMVPRYQDGTYEQPYTNP